MKHCQQKMTSIHYEIAITAKKMAIKNLEDLLAQGLPIPMKIDFMNELEQQLINLEKLEVEAHA